jgi:hypothetical protein
MIDFEKMYSTKTGNRRGSSPFQSMPEGPQEEFLRALCE